VTGARQVPLELDLSGFPPIDLRHVEEAAALQRRFDAKYLVPRTSLPQLLGRFAGRMRVLEVEGSRATWYRTVYFDTPGLHCYREHLQGRRRRFKVRVRHYQGAARTTMLEVKLKGVRGRTDKLRWCHPASAPTTLDETALARVDTALQAHYDRRAPAGLGPAAMTGFQRTTLVDPVREERVTIDTGLEVEVAGQRVHLGANHAIVETKTPSPRGSADRTLLDLGFRPGRLSKYCLGIAASAIEVPRNPWLGTLRTLAPTVEERPVAGLPAERGRGSR
jgi:hypothetical protein